MSVTGEPPSVVVEETAQEADVEVIPEIIEGLSILDVLRISAVLEDTTDQLSILNYIMPVQYERRQSSSMVYFIESTFSFYFSIYSIYVIKFNMGNSIFISDKGYNNYLKYGLSVGVK